MNGCLVIGKNTGGTKMIMEKAHGCEIPYLLKSELIDAMHEVTTKSSSFYKERVLKAQKIASANFSIEKNGSDIYSFYESILKI